MKTIGIIGANGQVGSEVALYLTLFPDVKVVPICRTKLSSTLLRRCGLECRHGDAGVDEQARNLFEGCDLVADFTLPKGPVSQIRSIIKRCITNEILYSQSTARYVYISTLMVYGMKERDCALRWYWLPKTVYASYKRYAERLVKHLGASQNREIYILRLGQVYGELQNITKIFRSNIRNDIAHVPKGYSLAVFSFSIAEALVNIANGKEKPGVYTLVSEPGYSWKELFEHYAIEAGFSPQVEVDFSQGGNQGKLSYLSKFWQAALRKLIGMVMQHRELLTGNILCHFSPHYELSAKAAYSMRSARLDIARMTSDIYRPFEAFDSETIPGRRLTSLTDPRITMVGFQERLQALLNNSLPNG